MKTAVKRVALTLVIISTFLVVLMALRVRRLPELEIWHTAVQEGDFTVRDVGAGFDLRDYMRQEQELFAELESGVEGYISSSPTLAISRFDPGGFNNPLGFPRNWNRTFELFPEEIRGGALLLHGLSDSPYSLRKVGEILVEQGYYVLGLRLPGHGTIPSGLLRVRWEDWMAATQLAMAGVRERVGGQKPILMAGYSNGGTLAVRYALDAIQDESLIQANQLILFSPAIGISSLAKLAGLHRLLSFIPYFERLRWLDILPEYDPYKYNSFTKNAATQSYRVTTGLQKEIDRFHRSGRLESLPPILTFVSLVDATVLSEAIVDRLYSRLDDPDSELVVFDVNRMAMMKPFYRTAPLDLLDRMEEIEDLPYRLTVLSNDDAESRRVAEWSRPARSLATSFRDLELEWPQGVFSLSHVAVPFPPDDPIYGRASSSTGYGLPIGALEPRGERHLLLVSADHFFRLRHNPFFSYMEERLVDLVAPEEASMEEVP